MAATRAERRPSRPSTARTLWRRIAAWMVAARLHQAGDTRLSGQAVISAAVHENPCSAHDAMTVFNAPRTRPLPWAAPPLGLRGHPRSGSMMRDSVGGTRLRHASSPSGRRRPTLALRSDHAPAWRPGLYLGTRTTQRVARHSCASRSPAPEGRPSSPLGRGRDALSMSKIGAMNGDGFCYVLVATASMPVRMPLGGRHGVTSTITA